MQTKFVVSIGVNGNIIIVGDMEYAISDRILFDPPMFAVFADDIEDAIEITEKQILRCGMKWQIF